MLTGAATSLNCTKYEYNTFGELLKHTDKDTTNGSTFITQYTYNNMGGISTLTYPSGNKVTYS